MATVREFFLRHLVCRFKGHDFGSAVYISPAVLTFCHRCGQEIQGRTIEDLEPMTDEDHDWLDSHPSEEQ